MKKKVLFLAAVLCTAVLAAGCGEKKAEVKTEQKATTAKTTATKTTATKAAASKTTATKTAAKTTASKTTKTTTKAAATKTTAAKLTPVIVVQCCGYEVTTDAITEKVTTAVGKSVKELNIYVKPEEGTVYYTADGEQGSVAL